MSTTHLRSERGFTLVELMVVVLIIGILAMVAIPLALSSAATAASTTCLANRSMTEHAEFLFELEQQRTSTSIDELIETGYMKSVPQCPSDGVYVWEEPETPGGFRTLACSVHYAKGLEALFASDFTDMTGLTPLLGKWSIKDGKLIQSTTDYQNRLSFGSTSWTDYTVSLTARLDSGSGYGVYYRADTKSNISGYIFQYDPGLGKKFVVRVVTNGSESAPIKTVSMPAGFDIYGTDHNIEVSVVGTHQVIKVDGVVVMELDDDTYSSGATGLRTWANSSASFDDLAVNPALSN